MSAHARNVAAIAMVLLALCRADAAGKDATLADTQRPESADDLNRRGADLEREGRYTEAEAQFFLSRDACRRNACPFLAAILNNLGSLYYAAARHREAELVLRQAIEISSAEGPNPAFLAPALVNLAALYRTEARYTEAEELYERALELGPADTAFSRR